ncbi:MAG TPA: nitrate ABC transporter [Phycisphaerales bacterium]|nr:nitrate ABC transporter [Phycisphaerales bacterium]HCD33981.1 nitrate ABC transporter [Phycisphaerales bacterium]
MICPNSARHSTGTNLKMMRIEKPILRIGFVPLTDCAPLVVAQEMGFFTEEGLAVDLVREGSWAGIRDKVAYGVFDAAQMLAPMPIATTLGIAGVRKPTITALSLDLNGNAITVSTSLYEQMCEALPAMVSDRKLSAKALKKVIDNRVKQGKDKLTFGIVFPTSMHNYELRYWMASAGIDPDHDVQLITVPPPHMVSFLKDKKLDGYCVGEPWNTVATLEKVGRTVITGYEIWNNSPEKVLGVNSDWADRHPNTHFALIRAVLRACDWIEKQEDCKQVVDLLAQERYVGALPSVIGLTMCGKYQFELGKHPELMPDFNVFGRFTATFPWRSHAVWFVTQMKRWGQVSADVDERMIAEATYRPEIYRAAASELGINFPTQDYKAEGTHAKSWSLFSDDRDELTMGSDVWMDGQVFDPSKPSEYLARLCQASGGVTSSKT